MDRQLGAEMDRQLGAEMDRQLGAEMDRQLGAEMDRQLGADHSNHRLQPVMCFSRVCCNAMETILICTQDAKDWSAMQPEQRKHSYRQHHHVLMSVMHNSGREANLAAKHQTSLMVHCENFISHHKSSCDHVNGRHMCCGIN